MFEIIAFISSHSSPSLPIPSLSGAVLQPSDMRLKTDITPLDSATQLSNVRNLPLYRYRLSDAWAETCGRTGVEVNLGPGLSRGTIIILLQIFFMSRRPEEIIG